jgi:hypothetical protein
VNLRKVGEETVVSEMIEILVPVAESKKELKSSVTRVKDLDNLVIGMMDNKWKPFVPFLDRVEELLSERYKSSRVIRRAKPHSTSGAPADLIDELATSCQVIINGLGA